MDKTEAIRIAQEYIRFLKSRFQIVDAVLFGVALPKVQATLIVILMWQLL